MIRAKGYKTLKASRPPKVGDLMHNYRGVPWIVYDGVLTGESITYRLRTVVTGFERDYSLDDLVKGWCIKRRRPIRDLLYGIFA